jgi:maltose/maltodextrin transport system permease protein
VDGASSGLQFRRITVPLLRSALLPVLLSSFAFNFNQFAAIYLLTAGGPAVPGSEAGATDILITYSYKLAFNLFQYGMACAYAIFIFILVATLSGVNFKLTGAFEDVN